MVGGAAVTTTTPRHLRRRAWIEAWDRVERVAGRDRWLHHREGPPDVMVHPTTGTVHVLGQVEHQHHGRMTLSEMASWPGTAGAWALEHAVSHGWERPLYGRLREVDPLCGRDVVFLCRHVGSRWASCGREIPRDTAMDPPAPDARVCGGCVRRTPGWGAEQLRTLARDTHDERVAADVAAAARVAANLGVSS